MHPALTGSTSLRSKALDYDLLPTLTELTDILGETPCINQCNVDILSRGAIHQSIVLPKLERMVIIFRGAHTDCPDPLEDVTMFIKALSCPDLTYVDLQWSVEQPPNFERDQLANLLPPTLKVLSLTNFNFNGPLVLGVLRKCPSIVGLVIKAALVDGVISTTLISALSDGVLPEPESLSLQCSSRCFSPQGLKQLLKSRKTLLVQSRIADDSYAEAISALADGRFLLETVRIYI